MGTTLESRRRPRAVSDLLAVLGPLVICAGVLSCGGDNDKGCRSLRGQPGKYSGPCTVEVDIHADGESDQAETRSYDECDRILEVLLDDNADGMPGVSLAYEYNDDGELLTKSQQDLPHGTLVLWSFGYDGQGRIINEEGRDCGSQEPADCLSKDPFNRTTHTYDGNSSTVIIDSDEGADGTVESRITQTYNSDALLVQEDFDQPFDGVPDESVYYSYNNDRKLSLKEFDQSSNGTVETDISYSYDSDGNLSKETRRDDGLATDETTFSYDSWGNVLTADQDQRADGTVDNRTTYGYQCWTE